MTGARVSRRGGQGVLGMKPDTPCLVKVVAGGMPLAVYGGRREIMQKISPLGPVYQAGTLSGSPLAVTAGLATLKALTAEGYERLANNGGRPQIGLERAPRGAQLASAGRGVGSLLKRC